MSTDIEEQKAGRAAPDGAGNPPRPSRVARIAADLRQLDWRQTALVALVMALVWCVMMFTASALQLLAGIVPLVAGLYLGRRVKERLLLHGLALGLLSFVFGLALVAAYTGVVAAGLLPLPNGLRDPASILIFYLGFSPFAMIPFPAFGTLTAGRNEQRAREARDEVDKRGGRLERYSRVADLSDLQGLSLPQLGKYVSDIFKKQGFDFKDWRFIGKKGDQLDLFMEYKGESWVLRLSVSDRVTPGTVESLSQEMRQRQLAKGLVITSTEFTPDAQKSAKGKRQLLLIDGPTLLAMHDS